MESISEKLLTAREAKGVSLEQAARDTHISKRYIVALESDALDEFPGEAYLLGFLRSYATYLELESDELVALYRNMQLQEQPAPINELLNRRPPRQIPVKPIVLTVLVLIILGGVLTLFLTDLVRMPSFGRTAGVEVSREPPFLLEEQFVERRFSAGDRVAIPVDGQQSIFEFVAIGSRVAIGSEAGIVEISDNDERLLDITGEGTPDVRVAIRRIYGDDAPPAVVARIDRVLESSPSAGREPTELSDSDRVEIAIGDTLEPSRQRSPQVVTPLNGAEQFSVEADILGVTVFRYQVDDQPRQEQLLSDGDQISFAATGLARMWVSNAGNVRLSVSGSDLDLGSQGEVVARVLRRSSAGGAGVVELLPLY